MPVYIEIAGLVLSCISVLLMPFVRSWSTKVDTRLEKLAGKCEELERENSVLRTRLAVVEASRMGEKVDELERLVGELRGDLRAIREWVDEERARRRDGHR